MENTGGAVSFDNFMLNTRRSKPIQNLFVFSQRHSFSDFCSLFSLTNEPSGPPERTICSSRSEPLDFIYRGRMSLSYYNSNGN